MNTRYRFEIQLYALALMKKEAERISNIKADYTLRFYMSVMTSFGTSYYARALMYLLRGLSGL